MADIYNYEANGAAQTKTDIERVGVCVPMDIQNHFTQTVQTQNAVSVALSSNSQSGWYSSDGFTNLAVSLMNDNNTTNCSLTVIWSYDGTNIHGADLVLNNSPAATWSNTRSGITDVKAPWYKIAIANGDSAAAHTMSAWAYLKA